MYMYTDTNILTFILDASNWFYSLYSLTFNMLPRHEQHILHYQCSARYNNKRQKYKANAFFLPCSKAKFKGQLKILVQ